ncbi:MAG: dTMP kinase [Ruminococcaceae bacterium]|nr:dTMP kinase [Oscillospiraceae bacterium]
MGMGKFIVFEGIDGAGKTTQAAMLSEKLRELGRKVYMTAEPTGFQSGKELREVLSGKVKKSDCQIALMFTLDRVAHNIDAELGIEKMLSEGIDVICDRYYYSTLAYQGSVVDYGWVKNLNTACPEIRHPDICVFLDLTPEESMRRICRGRESTEIYENTETLTRVRNSFMAVLEDLGDEDRIAIIDASRGIEDIQKDIVSAVLPLLEE